MASRPSLPEASTIQSSYLTDLERMARQQNYTDLIFLCGTVGFSAHRFMMASARLVYRLDLLKPRHFSLNSGTHFLCQFDEKKAIKGQLISECPFDVSDRLVSLRPTKAETFFF